MPDGKEGIMVGVSPGRVRLEDEQGNRLGLYNRDELTGVAHRGSWSGYDRIIMNPPFSNRQDAEHVRHAYELLRPNGRIVAIMGEGVFFGDKYPITGLPSFTRRVSSLISNTLNPESWANLFKYERACA